MYLKYSFGCSAGQAGRQIHIDMKSEFLRILRSPQVQKKMDFRGGMNGSGVGKRRTLYKGNLKAVERMMKSGT